MASTRKGKTYELFENKVPLFFGGTLVKGHAKKQRPLSRKHAVHLVLKSNMAKGELSMLSPAHAKAVRQIIQKQAKKFKIRIYNLVNVGNHLHLAVKLPNVPLRIARKLFQSFLRAVTGLIARQVLGSEKGSPRTKRFWTYLPYTRLVSFGREFRGIKAYMLKIENDAMDERIRWGYVPDPYG